MIRLLLVEATRLTWRRAVLWLLVATIVVPVGIGLITIVNQAPPTGDEYAEAAAMAEREAKLPYVQRDVDRCVTSPRDYGVLEDEADLEAACRELVEPQPEWFLDYYSQLDLVAERESGAGLGIAVIAGLLLLLVGTTFVGHDWNTGSMSNQLLFENRRLRIWSAKAIAVTVVSLVVATVATTAFWFVLAARYWAGGADLPDGVLLDGLQQGWRAAGIGGLAALTGYGLTMLTRSTVVTLGLLFGVSVAGSIFIGVVVDDPAWVDPALNVRAVLLDGTTYYVDVPDYCYAFDGRAEDPRASEDECVQERPRTLQQGVTYLGFLTAAGCAASAASYRRRDVP